VRRWLFPKPLSLAELGSRYGIVLVWGVVIAAFSGLRPDQFPTPSNFQTIFGTQAVLLILTLGLIVTLTAGEFDLSVGGVMSVSIILVGWLNVVHHWPIGAAVVVALGAGVLVGLVHAFLIIVVGLESIVVTLGTGTLLFGLGFAINSYTTGGISSELVQAIRNSGPLGLSLVFYYGLALTVLLWYVWTYTPLGRYLYFVGAGREVARLSGLKVNVIRAGALVGTSLISSLAGVALAGQLGSADPNTARAFLLPAFAGAFLGSTAVTPGRFNPWGAFIAVYFLITGITGLNILGYSGWVEDVFYGGSLVVAITFSHLARRRMA
jgi:ribose transport system permease protein